MLTLKNLRGFTLIEELVTLSVILFMLTIGVPSMMSLLNSNRQINQLNILAHHLHLVRSAAIFDHKDMIICKSSDGKYCDKSANWNHGWITFHDKNNNTQRDEEESISISQGKLPITTPIHYSSFGGSKNYVRFYSQGYSHTNGTFVFCNPDNYDKTKAIIISKTGRVRIEDNPSDKQKKKCLLK